MFRVMKIILIVLFGFSLVSCSRLDLGVKWADTLIISQVDDFFDLKSDQEKNLGNISNEKGSIENLYKLYVNITS